MSPKYAIDSFKFIRSAFNRLLVERENKSIEGVMTASYYFGSGVARFHSWLEDKPTNIYADYEDKLDDEKACETSKTLYCALDKMCTDIILSIHRENGVDIIAANKAIDEAGHIVLSYADDT